MKISFLIMKLLREWIVGNRNGYYSSSTVSQAHTRSYHGMFVTLEGDHSRNVLLSKMWENMKSGENEYGTDCNYFGDIVHPRGYKYLYEYEDYPIPTFKFRIGEVVMEKEILWDPNHNALYIRYTFPERIPDMFSVTPLLAFRKAGSINKDANGVSISRNNDELTFQRGEMRLSVNNGNYFFENADIYRNFTYNEERERGYGYSEDLFSPGIFKFEGQREIIFRFHQGEEKTEFQKSKNSFIKFTSPTFKNSEIPERMQGISNFFITGDNIIAGYHWFGAWSRDALISIPGLLLVRGKFDEAKGILSRMMRLYPDGKIRNYEGGEIFPADSPLLFIYALKKYMDYSNDLSFIRSSINYLDSIMNNYIDGFEGIKMEDALITVPQGTTWMDARCDGNFITPRSGKPVEINALWFNALSSMKEFYFKMNIKPPENYDEVIAKVRSKFIEKFVEGNSIKDLADPDDHSIRPNMLFAFSLPYPVINNIKPFLESIKDLITPYGLRTLSPSDRNFVSVYEGDQCSRDMAYHNGTVWPWLIGPYITSAVRAGVRKDYLRNYFGGIMNLNYIPEIFDGFIPDNPKGCMIQAWSYAEIIRAYIEDLR